MRSYTEWQRDAAVTKGNLTKLGNELREHWDDWKKDPACPYVTLDECLQAELGISRQALKDRNYRERGGRERDPSEASTTPNRTVEKNREAIRSAESAVPENTQPIKSRDGTLRAVEALAFIEQQKSNAIRAYDMWMELDEPGRKIIAGVAKAVAEQWQMIAEASTEYLEQK